MREGWRRVSLGEMFEPSGARLGDHRDEPPVFSVSKYDGVIPAEEFFGKRVASANLSGYKVLPADAWVYSTIHIDEGSIARNNTGADGVVSPMYTVMRWKSSQDDPRYLELILRSRQMLSIYADSAQGSINRRRSLPWAAFSAIEVVVPPFAEQQRIVDLIASVDRAAAAAAAEAEACAALLAAALDGVPAEPSKPIGAVVASIASGASWSKGDVRTSAQEGSPVLTIVNTKPDGTVGGEPTYVTGLGKKTARLTSSSIVAIRTNGNQDRIGNVYRVPVEHVGAAVSAFQLVIEPEDPANSDYLYWMMRRPSFQASVTTAASGSTGLGNIAASKLREMTLPWLHKTEERSSATVTYERLADAADAGRATAEALRTLRSDLLTVLLSGEHEIPSSYDELLREGIAA